MAKKPIPIFPRGSEWRKWDLHVHTPASFHWSGKRFVDMNMAERTQSIDEMINAINASEVAVFALMDYWTFDGWFAFKKRLSETGAPKCTKCVFPGTELRLVSPTSYRLNAHVIFSDDIDDQDLKDFKSRLEVALINQPLSDDCLMRLARKVGADILKEHGHEVNQVKDDDSRALLAGSQLAEIKSESYKEAIRAVPSGKAVGFMPWDTHDGLAEAQWKKHYSYVIDLMSASTVFETRKPELWAAFNGNRTLENQAWYDAFRNALGEKPKLAVSGSDAHAYSDYGRYPSDKTTWIKADPTFLGLLQAIKESGKRAFLGERPSKLREVEENKTFFLDSVNVSKEPKGTGVPELWLDGCDLPLNHDLVAVIGNKGSGKSALADVIALLGGSKNTQHFSFLSSRRFRAQPVPAKHFKGQIAWADGKFTELCLAENLPVESPELVKYIPQAYFEELCNAHVSGQSDKFENELRAVVFAHTNESMRREALSFSQLIEREERTSRETLAELRKELGKLNTDIAHIEGQLSPAKRTEVEQLLVLKNRQIEEHNKIKPGAAIAPTGQLDVDQQAATDWLKKIGERLKEIEGEDAKYLEQQTGIAAKVKAVDVVKEQLGLLARQHRNFVDATKAEVALLGLSHEQLLEFAIDETELNKLAVELPRQHADVFAKREKLKQERSQLMAAQIEQNKKLNEPQLKYQQQIKALVDWEVKLKELVGGHGIPDSLEGIKTRLGQLDALPADLGGKRKHRVHLAQEIFAVLSEQRRIRADLFKPVQDLIEENELIKNDYKLQFEATLAMNVDVFSANLFTLVKQSAGEFRGESESMALISKIADKYDFDEETGALGFIQELAALIEKAAKRGDERVVGIESMLRVNKSAQDVYDFLFGFSFLDPRYTLRFQETPIEFLSPGQRGALLLIFYLLVDKGHNPIILDQPEENLDNETVVSLLVPVVSEAKKRRQIIMVTHNPNLAVVCDAEQVVYASFSRKGGCAIRYVSGSIENPTINRHAVDVLEGTKPAFNNRRWKYH
jgi:ABC-type uncharacterized transport system ATPase component